MILWSLVVNQNGAAGASEGKGVAADSGLVSVMVMDTPLWAQPGTATTRTRRGLYTAGPRDREVSEPVRWAQALSKTSSIMAANSTVT